jgi:hypothetical protein
LCKLQDAKLGARSPEARLKPVTPPPPPQFTYTVLDLFGPYLVRGEVKTWASVKAYTGAVAAEQGGGARGALVPQK